MLQDGAWKLIQRKLYSWLSSKCGLPVCVVGLLLVLISALQFGEVGRGTDARSIVSDRDPSFIAGAGGVEQGALRCAVQRVRRQRGGEVFREIVSA